MDKGSKKIESIVLDTNVIFSSLLKEEGYTQAILSILLSQKAIRLLVPSSIKEEIRMHLPEISRKSALPGNIINDVLNLIFNRIESIEEEEIRNEIIEAFDMVRDRKDAPFAGLAIKYRPSIILTYNKKHFNTEMLERKGILVFKPDELVKHFDLEIKLKKKITRKRGILRLLSKLYILKRER